MRGKRAKALRTRERPNPGRKHGGAAKLTPASKMQRAFRKARAARIADDAVQLSKGDD